MALKHTFVSAIADGGDATVVRPSDWNATHEPDVDGVVFPARTDNTEVATPAADHLVIYAKKVGGRCLPKWVGPSGVDTAFQPFMGTNTCRNFSSAAGTTATTVLAANGGGYTAVGTTFAATTPATGTLRAKTGLSTIATSTTAGNIASIRTTGVCCAVETGFFLVSRFGLAGTLQAGNRGFCGLLASGAVITNIDPAAAASAARVGMGFNLNTGNWFLYNGTGAAVTALDLGASFPLNTTNFFEMVLFCKPGVASVDYRITELNANVVASGTLTTNLPGTTTYLSLHHWITNNATAAASTLAVKSHYLETDY
jgi:hypothetical protein